MNWAALRAEFPALEKWTYLNTATFGQVPRRARAAIERHMNRRDELACSDFVRWFDDADEIRGLLGRLINCQPEDLAFVTNASTALSLLLGGIEWRAGDRIATLRDEFPNHYYYAHALSKRGVEFVELTHEQMCGGLPAGARVVLVSTVNYVTGLRPDIARISQLAHECGALLYVDGTQSLGALRFDIQSTQPDMFAVDGYKWLLCPNGAAFFYISPLLRKTLPPAVIGWRSDRGWRTVDELFHGYPDFPEGAERYEGGMLNFPSLYAMREVVRMVLEIGPERIERRVLELAEMTVRSLRKTGATILHEQSNIIAAHWPDRDVSALVSSLSEQRILVAARHGNLRVSPHFYNDESDLVRLAAALE